MTVITPSPESEVTMQSIDWHLKGVPGVGAKTLAAFQAAGISNIWQLLYYLPTRFEDHTRLLSADQWDAAIDGEAVVIEGVVTKTWSYFNHGKKMVYCQIASDAHTMRIGFFRMHPQAEAGLAAPDIRLRCYGKIVQTGHVISMYHPKYWVIAPGEQEPLATTLTPVYKALPGVAKARLSKVLDAALARVANLNTVLPFAQNNAMGLGRAFQLAHHPAPADHHSAGASSTPYQQAQFRLAQEEALAWCALLAPMHAVAQTQAPQLQASEKNWAQTYIVQLPFVLTDDQQSCLEAIATDLVSGKPMMRLVQGDVGCGKTVVGIWAMLKAVEAGYQAAMLVPTSVLAKQHFHTLQTALSAFGVRIACLTAEGAAKDLADLRQQIAEGVIDIVVGTHALLLSSVCFQSLAMVVIDEQHRFGVEQRAAITRKGKGGVCHALLMSATPIPRSLARTLFQVSACSMIQSMPAGRQPIQTTLLSATKRAEVMQRVLAQAAAGAQVYWVCPKIESDENNARMSAENIYQQLQGFQTEVTIGLLHGRLSAEDKSRILQAFSDGQLSVLVSTVVIEVGVHVPDATIMVIDSAQQFGMAQLHQLRGRVGRASKQGYCILLYDTPLTEEAKQRLETVRACHDGFALAEQDLMQRGPGDVCGTLQSGCPPWRLLSWPAHADLLQQTQQQLEQQPLTHYETMLIQALWR